MENQSNRQAMVVTQVKPSHHCPIVSPQVSNHRQPSGNFGWVTGRLSWLRPPTSFLVFPPISTFFSNSEINSLVRNHSKNFLGLVLGEWRIRVISLLLIVKTLIHHYFNLSLLLFLSFSV